MVTKISSNDLLEMLNRGGWAWTHEDPNDHPGWHSRSPAIINAKMMTIKNVPTIQVRYFEKGPVHHVPCTEAMEFQLISPTEVQVWKKGTWRYSFKRSR